MDIFTKNKLTVFTIALLLVINLCTLMIIWYGGREIFWPPRTERPPENEDRVVFFLKNELGLNHSQVLEYRRLRLQHLRQSREINDDIRRLKRELLDQLFSEHVDSQKVTLLIQSIGEKQKIVERITFDHFLEMKKLCGEGQQVKLRRLLDDSFSPPRPQRPPEFRDDRPEPLPPRGRPDDQFFN